MAEVLWSVTAGNDLQEIEDFISRDAPLRAITFVDRLVDAAESLQFSPGLGRVVPEFDRPELREILFRGYRVVYVVQQPGVIILRVVHGARQLRPLLPREPWVIE